MSRKIIGFRVLTFQEMCVIVLTQLINQTIGQFLPQQFQNDFKFPDRAFVSTLFVINDFFGRKMDCFCADCQGRFFDGAKTPINFVVAFLIAQHIACLPDLWSQHPHINTTIHI